MGVTRKQAQDLPAGTVMHFPSISPPKGWLKANGQIVSRSTFSKLFSAIGTNYGNGDGVSTFALPDLRGEFIRSLDDGRGVDINRSIGSFQGEQMQAHTHGFSKRTMTFGGTAAANVVTTAQTGDVLTGPGNEVQSGSTGGNEVRPRNVALLACIKV